MWKFGLMNATYCPEQVAPQVSSHSPRGYDEAIARHKCNGYGETNGYGMTFGHGDVMQLEAASCGDGCRCVTPPRRCVDECGACEGLH